MVQTSGGCAPRHNSILVLKLATKRLRKEALKYQLRPPLVLRPHISHTSGRNPTRWNLLEDGHIKALHLQGVLILGSSHGNRSNPSPCAPAEAQPPESWAITSFKKISVHAQRPGAFQYIHTHQAFYVNLTGTQVPQ